MIVKKLSGQKGIFLDRSEKMNYKQMRTSTPIPGATRDQLLRTHNIPVSNYYVANFPNITGLYNRFLAVMCWSFP